METDSLNWPPAPLIRDFDLPLARQLAEFSRRAYAPDPTDHVIGSPDSQVLIQDIGEDIVLAFRGTANLRDWLTDIQIVRHVDVGGVKIHLGFLGAIDSILPAIIAALLPAGADKAKIKPLLITGHSLGGALASLAAFFLAKQNFQVRAVYTFASPRVGNAAFRDAYAPLCGSKTFRVVCAGDLVPLIPGIFTPPRDGYRHVGLEVFLDGSLHIDPSRCLELIADGWRTYVAIKSNDWDFILQFHSITGDYIAKLNRLGNNSTL